MFCLSQGGVGYKIDPKSKHRPRNNAATAGKKGISLSSNFIPQKSFPPEVHSSNQMYPAAFRDMSSQSQSATNSVLKIMLPTSSAATGHPVTAQAFSVPTSRASSSLHSITVAEIPPLHPTVQLQSLHWHSAMSPHPYELVPVPAKAQKCYGCGANFLNKYHLPPFNIVVRHMDGGLYVKTSKLVSLSTAVKMLTRTTIHILRISICFSRPVQLFG